MTPVNASVLVAGGALTVLLFPAVATMLAGVSPSTETRQPQPEIDAEG
jgi:hypothetical protein